MEYESYELVILLVIGDRLPPIDLLTIFARFVNNLSQFSFLNVLSLCTRADGLNRLDVTISSNNNTRLNNKVIFY
jgi:hypothetical protein